MKSPASIQIPHDEIAQLAHQFWEDAGRPDGQETAHWLRAERQLRAGRDQGKAARRTAGKNASSATIVVKGNGVYGSNAGATGGRTFATLAGREA